LTVQFVLGLVAAWLLSGLVAGYVMRRLGHDFFVWFALGSVIGPLVFPLAIARARVSDVERADSIPHRPSPGKLDVVVGLDGSEESLTALQLTVDMLGDSATSITVATVLDYEARTAPAGEESRAEAAQLLEESTKHLEHPALRTQILYGRPDRALSEFALHNGKELIVVGARGRGAAEALFGSVTERLVGDSEVPVLVARKKAREPLSFIGPD
jgi:nucleotide-binding universal stress UspA family protein